MKNLKIKAWYFFIKPKSQTEDEYRREFILNVILCSFLIFLLFLSCLFTYSSIRYSFIEKIKSLVSLIIIWIPFLSLLYLSRKGYIKTASYGLISLIILFSTMGSIEWGFDLPAVIISYLIIVVLSSILFNTRTGILITLFLSILIFIMGYYQIYIHTPNSYWRLEGPAIIDTFTYSIELFFIMSISWLSNYQLEKSLSRARKSEERLAEELERITRVYHFVEFGKLSSGAFHDLMNTLTSISINIEDLQNNTKIETKETISFIKSAIKASNRMKNFIEAIEKQIKPKEILEKFSVNDEVELAIELLSYKARREKCEIVFISKDIYTIYGNSLAFYQTITNLLSNAIDSYDSIDKKRKTIEIILTKEFNFILVQIKDYGVGITIENKNKIFDHFYTTKPSGKGIGLGLAVSKERIEKEFGGTISVESEEGKGTTFTISLPKRRGKLDIDMNN